MLIPDASSNRALEEKPSEFPDSAMKAARSNLRRSISNGHPKRRPKMRLQTPEWTGPEPSEAVVSRLAPVDDPVSCIVPGSPPIRAEWLAS